jgi:hypothetical protein
MPSKRVVPSDGTPCPGSSTAELAPLVSVQAAFREQLTAAVHASGLLHQRDLSDKRTHRAVVEELIRDVE